ncbi:type I addiction module toxin, SymE family [Flavobacterium cupreum]|uniref:Type I addiction module toxin, SymE family n=1 Tax=Flavobacterium cupreum TaxID=2133766 RepID=A0A434A035_9FLAO|nr:SymE family type I addiction module toxin [Flavobacterium cupreum]RUT67721.1 type I addiction module toxin, SymE family [Flavobacterium cupreum]
MYYCKTKKYHKNFSTKLITAIMAVRNPKQVKLQPKHRVLTYGYKTVPWLSVSGIWLEELGFKAGDTVRILTSEKQLIIELIENQIPEKQTLKKRK